MKFEPTRYDLGAERYLATGEVLPDSVLAEIRGHDAILLGAVGGKPGDPNLPPGILERGLLLRLRFELDHYVNLRPSRIFPGAASPLRRTSGPAGEVDFVVVREGTEGPYTGNGGAIRVGTPARGRHRGLAQHGVRRGARRPRRLRPGAAPAAPQAHAGPQDQRARARRRRVVAAGRPRSAGSSPTSTVDYLHIDAATIFMTTDPARFDVIVTDNLFGDIITDLAAAITGGIGLAASGNINPDRTAPSMFEPVHGSAPDIAGPAEGRPDRRDPVRVAAARPPRARRGRGRRRGGRRRRPRRPRPRHHAAYLRDRRRRRRSGQRLTERGRLTCLHGDQHHPTRPSPSTTRASPRSSPTRDSACTSPTTCSRSSGRRRRAGTTPRITPYGPLTLDPATAVLHYAQETFEGMKAYRHDGRLDLGLPSRGERRADGALEQAARAARAAGRGLRRRPSTRSSPSTSAGCRTRRARRASTSARS